MKRIIFIVLLTVPFLTRGQDTQRKKPCLPEFTYITPQMSKKQLDSLSVAFKKCDIDLVFDTVIYDSNKMIKELAGELDTYTEYFPFNSKSFKGMTIMRREDGVAIIMGLFIPPKKKK